MWNDPYTNFMIFISIMTSFGFVMSLRIKKYGVQETNYKKYRYAFIEDKFKDLSHTPHQSIVYIGKLLFMFNKKPNIKKIDTMLNELIEKNNSANLDLDNTSTQFMFYKTLKEEDSCDYKTYYKRSMIYLSFIELFMIVWIFCTFNIFELLPSLIFLGSFLLLSLIIYGFFKSSYKSFNLFKKNEETFYIQNVKPPFDKIDEVNKLFHKYFGILQFNNYDYLYKIPLHQRTKIIDSIAVVLDLISMSCVNHSFAEQYQELKDLITSIYNEMRNSAQEVIRMEQEKDEITKNIVLNEMEEKKTYLRLIIPQK